MVGFLAFAPYSNGEATGPTGVVEAGPTGEVKPYVIHKKITKTKSRKTIVKKFKPWAEPSPAQIHKIIDVEAAKWGASASRLRCRINGESTFRWNASNGQYQGLGQFGANAFSRGVASIDTRKVRYVYKVSRPIIYDNQITLLSDGNFVKRRVNKRRATYKYIRSGMLPKNPPRTHGWTQVRIMARAMVGLGNVNDSEWEVRC